MDIGLYCQRVQERQLFRLFFREFSEWELIPQGEISAEITESEGVEGIIASAESTALECGKKSGSYALVVLSRLVVPALPPGEKCRSLGLDRDQSDRQRCRQLLQEMKGLQGLARAAYYECAIGFYLPDGSVRSVSALCEGEILQEERGGQGFAFDSIFRKHGYEGTFGEVSEEVFARVSHYRKAFERLKYHLEQVEADLVATKP